MGISKETCIIRGGIDKEIGLFQIEAASPSSIVYVNGRRLKYVSKNKSLIDGSPIEEGAVILKHNDRVALGHCAYLLLVVDPVLEAKLKSEMAQRSIEDSSDTPSSPRASYTKEITYDTSVHEVMLMRAHGENEYKERLAAFVINKLRLPAVMLPFP